MDVLFVEPYDGGSHRAFREGLARWSRHRFDALTLPDRFWKWRMRGSAVWFADRIAARERPADLLLVTDYVNTADLRGLLPRAWRDVPLLLYMHENQLTYPLSPEEAFDFHFGMTNIVSALAADRVVFNSAYHRDRFLDALPSYLGRMPEAVPKGVRERLAARSEVLPVGIEREPRPDGAAAPWLGGPCAPDAGPGWPRDGVRPLILWNHRWEFDKRPELVRRVLARLDDAGLDFAVALLGDPRGHPEVFQPLRDRLGERIVAWGREPDRAAYARWLERADIVISAAAQEYFGIAVAEAVHAGAYAVLPRDQVYPSLYGRHCRGRHFWRDEEECFRLLADLLAGDGRCGHVCGLPPLADTFCWRRLAPRWDALLEEMVAA